MFVAPGFFWQAIDILKAVPPEDYENSLRELLYHSEPEQVRMFADGLDAGVAWFDRTAFLEADETLIGSAKQAAIVGLLAQGRREVEARANATSVVVSWEVEPYLDVVEVAGVVHEGITDRTDDVKEVDSADALPIELHIADDWLPRQWPALGRGIEAWRKPIELTIGPWLRSPNPDFLMFDIAPIAGDGRTHTKAVRDGTGIRVEIDYDADALPRPDAFETGVLMVESGLELIHRKYGVPMPERPVGS
ncbi:hypothetical protein [Promicromonospora sukumoe]|uniref:hypothetical protein n=1 Tax=Promicromonospora sukumoe TaxID=88382 RepID=UPI003654542D